MYLRFASGAVKTVREHSMAPAGRFGGAYAPLHLPRGTATDGRSRCGRDVEVHSWATRDRPNYSVPSLVPMPQLLVLRAIGVGLEPRLGATILQVVSIATLPLFINVAILDVRILSE